MDEDKLTVDFNSQELFEAINNRFNDIFLFDLVTDAYAFVQNFEQYLENNPNFSLDNPDLYKDYNNLLVKAKFLAVPMLNDNEIIDLYKYHFIEALDITDYDFWKKLKANLVAWPLLEDRDRLKTSIKEALGHNQQLITKERIASGGVQLNPTIENWLKDYASIVGVDFVEPIQTEHYLSNSNNAKKLVGIERDRLRALLQFFERLKYLSDTTLGIEEKYSYDINGVWKTLENGNWTEIRKDEYKNQAREAIKLWNEAYGNTQQPVIKEVGTLSPSKAVVANYPSTVTIKEKEVVVDPRLVSKKSRSSTAISPLNHEPVALKSPSPAFFFDIEDEKEADKFRDEDGLPPGVLEKKLHSFAEEIVKKHNFSFKDEINKHRFVQLFISRLKDVRSIVDVREMLLKSTDSGGLGLTSDKVEQVINIIEKEKKNFAELLKKPSVVKKPEPVTPKPVLPKMVPAPKPSTVNIPQVSAPNLQIKDSVVNVVIPPITTVVKPTPAENISPTARATTPSIDSSAQQQSTPPGFFDSDKIKQWREEMLKEISRMAPPVKQVGVVPKPTPATTVVRGPVPPPPPPPPPSGRPQLSDVKAPPRTLGPLEELKSLDLVDFRRLGQPLQALDKIKAKLDLIGEASVSKRLEAIRAWQGSSIYKLYLAVGRESIEQGKSVAEIVESYSARGEQTLTEAEFNAIADFNTKIRF